MKKLFILVVSAIIFAFPAVACETNEIDVLGDGTQCETAKFTLTTLSTDTFQFNISATGTFYVDCGNGGALETSGKTITRSNTTETTYACSWDSPGTQTIRFGGTAEDYHYSKAAIRFNLAVSNDTNAPKIVSISGNLSAMFPYIVDNAPNDAQPRFYETFYTATNLTNIPSSLFADYTIGSTYMFYSTFQNCTNLTSIPNGLFSNFSEGAPYMFTGTFYSCSELTSLPENLFSGISDAASNMFTNTFRACKKLSGYIPPSTFAGLIANGSQSGKNMWSNTFYKTILDTTCPSGTTQFITGYEDYWGEKVSCVDENLVCDAGEYFVAHGYECTQCPENSYCPGGTYPYSESLTQGITACATGYHSAAGSISVADCIANLINITWDHADSSDITANNAGSVTYGGDIRTPKKAQHINGKIFTGWVFNEPSGN